MDFFIIRSNRKGSPNWEGKDFSQAPAKAYSSFEAAVDALKGYWFHGISEIDMQPDTRSVKITPLTEAQLKLLIGKNKAKF